MMTDAKAREAQQSSGAGVSDNVGATTSDNSQDGVMHDEDGSILRSKDVMKHKNYKQSHHDPQPPPLRIGKRLIYLITSAAQKVDEFRDFFARYGIGVVHVDPYGFRTHGKKIQAVAKTLSPLAEQLLARGDGQSFWCKAVMWEQMQLLKWENRNSCSTYNSNPIDGERAVVRANLIVWHCWSAPDIVAAQQQRSVGLSHTTSTKDTAQVKDDRKAAVIEKEFYSNDVEGFIDESKRQSITRDEASKTHVFGFDDIFVVKSTNMSYHEKKVAGYKCSPRDANLSQYVAAHVHYKKRKQWSHLSSEAALLASDDDDSQRTISIGMDDGMACANFVSNTPQLQSGVARLLLPCFYTVVNDGVFFRAAISRREVNYWCPGLNAGIPFVKKKDLIHELTFLSHDFGHFLIPDLVFTGVHTPLIRRIYIVARMLSEATTLVFADMLLAEALRRSGVEYDWTKRAIWPLFEATGIDPFPEQPDIEVTLERFKELLDANALYCLFGDDSGYRKLLAVGEQDEEPGVLKKFKEKYMPFFVEDYRWTSHNYDDMVSRSPEFKRWWNLVSPLRTVLASTMNGSQLETVEEFAEAIGSTTQESLDGRELVHRSLQRMFETRIAPAFRATNRAAKPSIIRRNSLGRYMIGQMHLLARFPFIMESETYGRKLQSVLLKFLGQEKGVSEAQCRAVRGLFDQYVDVLTEKGLATADDAATYKEVCPLFEPCYVNYDRGLSFYEQLDDVQRRLLGEDDKVNNQILGMFPDEVDLDDETVSLSKISHAFVIDGVTFVDMAELWQKVGDIALKFRLRALLGEAGVKFWDGADGFLVRCPIVAISAVGGLPVSVQVQSSSNTRRRLCLGGKEFSVLELREAWQETMGLASMPCYMNPGNKTPTQMWEVLCKHGHFSVGHTVSLSFFLAGFSCGVENELNSQRDLVHLARLTVARTASQQQPPVVVQHPSLVPLASKLYTDILDGISEVAMTSEGEKPIKKADWFEASNLLWPAAKAQCAVLTGSLRAFQKLVASIDDEGKEAEYRRLLLMMNDSLHVLQPEMFKASNEYEYKLPSHFACDPPE